MKLSSIFKNNEKIPKEYTCDDLDINPPIEIVGIPKNIRSMVLIMGDPDAPAGTWDHWILFNIPKNINKIEENSIPQNALQGKNS